MGNKPDPGPNKGLNVEVFLGFTKLRPNSFGYLEALRKLDIKVLLL